MVRYNFRQLGLLFMSQEIFGKGKFARSITTNCSHICLLRQRQDLLSINTLSRRLFPNKKDVLGKIYRDATQLPYSYLLITLHPQIDDRLRLCTGIFVDEEFVVYVVKK